MAKPDVKIKRTFNRGAKLVYKLPATGDFPFATAMVSPDVCKEHVMLVGRSGGGKTQALLPMINYITERATNTDNNVAIISDISGEFVSKFYNPDTDYILNPFDARSELWSPFAEIEEASDCNLIAEALVQKSGSSDAREWEQHGERIVSDSLKAIHYTSDFETKDRIDVLFKILGGTDTEFAQMILAGTPSEVLFAEGNEKMLASIRAISTGSLRGLTELKNEGTFSVRKWLQEAVNGTTNKKILWIPYLAMHRESLKTLIATWLNLVVVQSISLEPSRGRQIFLVCDELDSLGKIARLKDSLTLGRKYGLSTITAIQTLSQLKDTYGENDAKTTIGNVSSKIVLGMEDFDTADYFSKFLGSYEETVNTQTTSTSTGSSGGGGSSGKSFNTTETIERNIPLVTPTQVMALEKNTGYAKIAGSSINGIQYILQFRQGISTFVKVAESFVGHGEPEPKIQIDKSDLAKVPTRFLTSNELSTIKQKIREPYSKTAKLVYSTIIAAIVTAAIVLAYVLYT